MPFQLALPDPKELRDVVTGVVDSLGERGAHAELRLEDADLDELVRALAGLTLNQARQAVARALLEDGVLEAGDLQTILEDKARALAQDGLLEFLPASDNAFALGGFERLKVWLERAQTGFTPEAQALNLRAPPGHPPRRRPGLRQVLAAKCIARELAAPAAEARRGAPLRQVRRRDGEEPARAPSTIAESMAPTVLWIDELEKSFGAGRREQRRRHEPARCSGRS